MSESTSEHVGHASAAVGASAPPVAEETAAAAFPTDSYGKSVVDLQTDLLEKAWGGDAEGFERNATRARTAIERLGLTDADIAEHTQGDPREMRETMEHMAELGRGMEDLPADLTPSKARELRAEIMKSPNTHPMRPLPGDAESDRRWRAIIRLAGRAGKAEQ